MKCGFPAVLLLIALCLPPGSTVCAEETNESKSAPPDQSANAETDTEGAKAHYDKGLDLQQNGKETEAIVEYNKAIKCDKSLFQAWRNLGVIYLFRRQFQQALPYAETAMKLNAKDVMTRDLHAGLLFVTGKEEQSIELYKQLVKEYPNDKILRRNLDNAVLDFRDKKARDAKAAQTPNGH